MDCSPPGSSVHGISQARILKWIVISFSRGSFTLVCVSRSVMSDYFEMTWAVALQAPFSMGFSKQEYWSGLPFPSPGDLPNPRIESGSPTLQADSVPCFYHLSNILPCQVLGNLQAGKSHINLSRCIQCPQHRRRKGGRIKKEAFQGERREHTKHERWGAKQF